MEEIKHVVTEEHEFEFRVELKIIAFFGVFGVSGFDARTRINFFPSESPLEMLKFPSTIR